VPDAVGGEEGVPLPTLDAVVGNPPYLRQEKVGKVDKKRFGEIANSAWPDLRLGGRSDLHCYFWPAAARLLKSDGYFGFLTSSSWLDVEYGFALQGWLLRHFRILAVMESAAEPWFEDARVKTCVTILQRCDDEAQRMGNRVRFVRFARKLSEIIGVSPRPEDEDARQEAVERLRSRILAAEADCRDEDMRIVVKSQGDLWRDGVRAGTILGAARYGDAADDSGVKETGGEGSQAPSPDGRSGIFGGQSGEYCAGKWGRYVRAPDFYFDVMHRLGSCFVTLGEIATVRYGVKTGCDPFFMPKDITREMLAAHQSDGAFRRHAGGAPRKAADSGKLRIIKDGAGVIHPIEARYLAPEVHSLMGVDRPVVRGTDLDRVVLLVSEPMDRLKTRAPWAWRYLRYGTKATFASSKSKPVPVPKRSFISNRPIWYDLTDQVKPGVAIWPKGQQYRHLVVRNPDGVIANCRLYDVAVRSPGIHADLLVATLNSTVVAFWRNFYGRYTGTEGAMETMVVDAMMTEVPNPALASPSVAARLARAFESMCNRAIGDLVEEQLMACHTPGRARRIAAGPPVLSHELQQSDRRALDDAVFELLGVSDGQERTALIDQLYEATARHFRDVRVVEIEKMEQRAKSANRRFSAQDLAADIWDAAELDDATPLAEWTGRRPESDSAVIIPEERPAQLANNPMFAPNSVYFGKAQKSHMDCASRGQAELVVRLANLGVAGEVKLPGRLEPCFQVLARVNERMEKVRARFRELAESRTGDERMQRQLMEVLVRWFVLGREAARRGHPARIAEREAEE